MKKIHLQSLVDSYSYLEESEFLRYVEYHDISFKKAELEDLKTFILEFKKNDPKIEFFFDSFFVGYTIPQIGKEFDLLRFGSNYTLNIELKGTYDEQAIKKQLIRNGHFLSFLEGKPISFTFVSDLGKLYTMSKTGEVIETNFNNLSIALRDQELNNISDADLLFNPSNYLVSPFNSTEEFMSEKYFLTKQQEHIKNEIFESINSRTSVYVSVLGKAGTGKTLLAFDVAKECKKIGVKLLIIHCGKLNKGHTILIEKYNWKIIPIRDLAREKISQYSVIFIDEVQRIKKYQLLGIIEELKKCNLSCVFSYDGDQCLRKEEINNKIDFEIKKLLNPKKYILTEKIRTNKEIASFIAGIFDKRKQMDKHLNRSQIELHYFQTTTQAKRFAQSQSEEGWTVINYTSDRSRSFPYEEFLISGCDNAHEVIGQEFDNVVAIIDSHFYYDSDNKLKTRGYKSPPFYYPVQMLFQIMTRTRRKLCVIIVDNSEILNRCLDILKPKNT